MFDRDDDGRVQRHVGIATDVTKQKQNEADLEQLNAQLSEFAYIVTHDMKAPINNIMGVCQLLGSLPEMQGGQAQQLLDMILSCCTQATDKIADVVRVSQMASLEFEQSLLSWERVLTHVRQRFKAQIDRVNAVVEGDFSSSPSVEFSRIQLESIVENLVGNALKYHDPDRAPEIKLRTYPVDDGGQVLEVRDNGIGIDVAQDGERIFGLFKRAQTERPGSGVGLYLVRRMIERAGGEVRVEGEPGKGAVFKLHFTVDQRGARAA